MNNFSPTAAEDINVLLCARRMKHVQRLAGIPTLRSQALAEHCYYTGLLFMYCAKEEHISISTEDITFVFMHDIVEVVTGDLLWPAKHSKNNDELWDSVENNAVKEQAPFLIEYVDKKLTGDTLKLFRACDMLEFLMCVQEERALGNNTREIDIAWNNAWNFLSKSDFPTIQRLTHITIGRDLA